MLHIGSSQVSARLNSTVHDYDTKGLLSSNSFNAKLFLSQSQSDLKEFV